MVSLAGGAWLHETVPRVHDEYVHLLAADTFASGRLANPTPPSPEHLETFHVLLEPRYASKYPPAPGWALAVGQWLGKPVMGVWLATSGAVVALHWMLSGYVAARWAWRVALLFVAMHAAFSVVGQSFLVVGLSILGSALIYGVLPRLGRMVPWVGGCAWASGLGLLANTRPFEGLLAAVPAGIAVAVWMVRGGLVHRMGWIVRWLAVALPLLAVVFLAMGFYNQQVTGSWGTLPYIAYERQMSRTPLFLFQSPAEDVPGPQSSLMRAFYTDWVEARYEQLRQQSVWHRLGRVQELLESAFFFPLWFWLLPLSWLAWRSRVMWMAWGLVALWGGAALLPVWFYGSYCGPFIPVVCLIMAFSLRELARWSRRLPLPRHWVETAAAGGFVGLVVVMTLVRGSLTMPPVESGRRWVQSQLPARERHLILIQYPAGHDPHQEWVSNNADPASSPWVWARALGAPRDERLIRAYPHHQPWRVIPGPTGGLPQLQKIIVDPVLPAEIIPSDGF